MLPQFRREVFIMYELHHPHIIKLYNHFEDERYFYLIMELADRGNLFHKLRKERQFSEQVAAQYFREIVLAVEYLHSHVPSIIHRDIKPENILFGQGGRLKLTDFGWSNYHAQDSTVLRFTMCGTLEYLPPEMVEHTGHDTSADIWCLGVLLFEMLVGHTPFKPSNNNRKVMMQSIREGKIKFPLAFPLLAKDLVAKMLHKSPAKRATVKEVKEDKWLLEHPPLMETITQELSPKQIPEPLKELKVQTGYLVINIQEPDNQGTEEVGSPIYIEPKAKGYRLSVAKLNDQVVRKTWETIDLKLNILTQSELLAKSQERMRELEHSTQAKKQEYYALVSTGKELLANISDISILVNKYELIGNLSQLITDSETLRKQFTEKEQEFRVAKVHREHLASGTRRYCDDVEGREKELDYLKYKLQTLKEERAAAESQGKAAINELESSVFILKSRLSNSDTGPNDFRKEDNEYIKDFTNHVADKSNTLFNQITGSIEGTIERCEESQLEKMKLLGQITLNYGHSKGEILAETRKRKNEIIGKIKTKSEEHFSNNREREDKMINQLKKELESSRRQEHMHFVEPEGLLKTKEKLKQLMQTYEQKMGQVRELKYARLETEPQLNRLLQEINDAELEMGTLKVHFLGSELLI